MNLKKLEIQRKDLLYIVLTVVILVAIVIVGYKQLNTASSSAGVTVEVVAPIGASFNADALDHIQDEEKAKNFVVPIDLGSGVGTTTPFGQL